MDKKRLLELAGVLNERLDPRQKFEGYSLEREDIAKLINLYVLDIDEDEDESRPETTQGIVPFAQDDERLTDDVCKKFIYTVVDWAMESAMGDEAHRTINVATEAALPKFMRRLRVGSKRQKGE